MNDSRKYTYIMVGIMVGAGLIMATLVFPFWNLIREDVYEEVVILSNDDGVCFATTSDDIPKEIRDCDRQAGETVTIKFGRDLAWATIVP